MAWCTSATRWAARAALRGEIAAIVTAPLHKEALAAAGFPYPGHTELLQAEAAAHLGRSDRGVFLLRKIWQREIKNLAEGRPLKQWTYRPDMVPTYPK